MEQHPVPQHIASFEFKLFGNLTIRQFVTLAIPMSIAIVIFFSNIAVIVRLPAAFAMGAFAFFIALVPVGGRPFEKWLMAFFRAIFAPTQRIWIKEHRLPEFLSITLKPAAGGKQPEPVTNEGREKLVAYLSSLPKKDMNPLDAREQLAMDKLGLGPGAPGEKGKLPSAIVWFTKQTSQLPYNMRSSLPQVALAEEAGESDEFIEGLESQTRDRFVAAPGSREQNYDRAKISAHAKPYTLHGMEKKLSIKGEAKVTLKAKLASDTNFSVDNVIPIQTSENNIRLVHGIGKVRVRKLHFAPPLGFDLSKLPIRGEPKLDFSDELKKKYKLDESLFLDQEANGQPMPVLQGAEVPAGQNPQNGSGYLSKSQIVPKPEAKIESVQNVSFKGEAKKAAIDSKIQVTSQGSPAGVPNSIIDRASILPLTNKPNVLSGIVLDSSGSPLDDAILTVRDSYGIPVRALKTNKLGQFLSATPLSDGQYVIEIDSRISTFKPISLALAGRVIEPMEIKGEGVIH